MPNHITNKLIVSGGTAKERVDFIKAVTNKHGFFSLNSIIPMPRQLRIDESSAVTELLAVIDDQVALKNAISEIKAAGFFNAKRAVAAARKMSENKKKYGHRSWYHWSLSNWGTKWNCYSVKMPVSNNRKANKQSTSYFKRIFKKQIQRFAYNNAQFEIEFETAWACPEPVYRAMAKRFPNLNFTVLYADEDIGSNCGEVTFSNGEVSSLYIAPCYSEMSEEEKIYWNKFAFHLVYPNGNPEDFGMDLNFSYQE